MSLFTISDIHPAIYYAALQNEGWNLPDNIEDAPDWYQEETERRGLTTGGFEQAIHDALTLSGPFAEENGVLNEYHTGYTVEDPSEHNSLRP